jgi:hypothetical protein
MPVHYGSAKLNIVLVHLALYFHFITYRVLAYRWFLSCDPDSPCIWCSVCIKDAAPCRP